MRYADVVFAEGRFRTVECPVAEGEPVAIFDGQTEVSMPAVEGIRRDGMFCRLAHGAGVSMVVAKAHQPDAGPVIVATSTGWTTVLHPTTHGNQCVGIEWLANLDRFRVTAVTSRNLLQQWVCRPDLSAIEELPAQTLEQLGTEYGDVSGFLDLVDGRPVWTSQQHGTRLAEVPSLRWFLWMRRGDWLIGHVNAAPGYEPIPDQIRSVRVSTGQQYQLAPLGIPVPPRIAVDDTEQPFAAVSLRADGPLVPFPSFVAIDPPRPVGSTPPPPTPPPPGEEPGPMPVLPNYLHVVEAVDRQYPHLLQRARDAGEPFRGAFTDQVAHALNRLENTTDWGRKARQNGVPASVNDDTVTKRLDPSDLSQKKLVDVVAGDHFDPAWDERPASEEPGNGFWHPPLNADLDAAGPGPVEPPPPTPPPPAVELGPILEAIRAQGETIGLLANTIGQHTVTIQQLRDTVEGLPAAGAPEYETSLRFLGTVRSRPVPPP